MDLNATLNNKTMQLVHGKQTPAGIIQMSIFQTSVDGIDHFVENHFAESHIFNQKLLTTSRRQKSLISFSY